MGTLVWVERWQMECCGEPFGVGDQVEWTAQGNDVVWLEAALTPDLASRIEHCEEHHHREPDEVYPLTGRVRSIRTAYCHLAPNPPGSRTLSPVPGSSHLVEIDRATGREGDTVGLEVIGYVVELESDDVGASTP